MCLQDSRSASHRPECPSSGDTIDLLLVHKAGSPLTSTHKQPLDNPEQRLPTVLLGNNYVYTNIVTVCIYTYLLCQYIIHSRKHVQLWVCPMSPCPAATAFRCAYCFALNPSRKKLPTAPRLDRQTSQGSTTSASSVAAAKEEGDNGEGLHSAAAALADREGQKEPTLQEENSDQQQQQAEATTAATIQRQSSS